jgi:Ca-activated chloride channel family protein
MIGVLLLLALPAQQVSRTERDFTLVSEVRLVLLDVGVTNREGEFISGLGAEAFHIFDNGAERPISVFAGEDQPVTVGLVIDGSSSMAGKRQDVRQAAATLIELSNADDEVFVVAFGDRIWFGLPEASPFTSDREELGRCIAAMPLGGRTSLYDGIRAALDRLKLGTRGRHALVVISDGGDNASRTSAADLRSAVRASRATVYAVGIYDLAQRERSPGFLRKLADDSGGLSFFPAVPAQLRNVARRIAADLRSRYVVGFQPPDIAKREERKLRVRVNAPGSSAWKVRTRRSYVALPMPGAPK